jgi:hypothetical protein
MPCLLIYGVSGAGKSMLLAKFQRDHAPKQVKRVGLQSIIATQMPPVPVIRSLYGEIVRSININARPSLRLHELENTAIEMLTHAAPRMLIIDEIQHLLSCTSREQRAALNAIKYLAIQLRMSIVAAGTHEALHVMRFDPQIASRFEQMELPIWTECSWLASPTPFGLVPFGPVRTSDSGANNPSAATPGSRGIRCSHPRRFP